jgi:hypothetical protein
MASVMLPAEILDLFGTARPARHDAGVLPEQHWLFPALAIISR